ncbi:saga complex subunit sgf29 [Colletotrichum kahawae]|uniref:Saga complex subunit sgf29 n=1 Tax=Colletotrichum kahawae TaxID=34407 RepID=A0AAD9YB70_COLKA|nr:saga complex subunit sgf29 [Colletotrichum kahawae]
MNILEPIDSTQPNAESEGPEGNVPDDGQTGSSSGAIGSSAAAAKPKVSFKTGDDVAFKRKNDNPLSPEPPYWWIKGEVAAVVVGGKIRRYKCVQYSLHGGRQEYKTSASDMMRIPSETEELEILEAGAMVLGLYPATKTFLAADVVVTDLERNMVSLNFHGEKDSNYAHEVERRFVPPYRP